MFLKSHECPMLIYSKRSKILHFVIITKNARNNRRNILSRDTYTNISHKEISTDIIVIHDTRVFRAYARRLNMLLARYDNMNCILFFHRRPVFSPIGGVATGLYDKGQGRKKRTREELWRPSVPGSDLSARGTCHARNADAKREHHAAVIAEKSLSSSNLKFRGQHKSTLWCHTIS